MKIIKILLVTGLVLALYCPAQAQPGAGQGMGPMMYDPQTVTTIKGVVESLATPARRQRHESRVVKTEQGMVTIYLGPAWFMDQHKFLLNPGETVEVTGSKIARAGETVIVAREVKMGGKTMQLRDDQGAPLWPRQGRQ